MLYIRYKPVDVFIGAIRLPLTEDKFPLFVLGTTLYIFYECSPFWVGISKMCI